MVLWPGSPSPLGATFDGSGVNFALYSRHATGVELCLFEPAGDSVREVRVALVERTGFVWHAYLPGIAPGQWYGYRVSGPWDPARGHRFNPHKVLLDPYARALGRPLSWDSALFAFERGTAGDGPADVRDSAPFAPLGQVVGTEPFAWGADRPPSVSWADTVVYELHVRGFTALNEAIPKRLRGTYLGVASAPAIEHLTSLGVTTVELLPIHAHADEWWLAETGRENYWGYNTLSYFVPDARFVSTGSVLDAAREFKTMVRALHTAGLEVILDVVYNHTAEGDHLGPTLSWRGIDNRSYYRLERARPSHYENFSGCGNTLDTRSPRVVELVMDSLRFWVEEMHVDGFRFDLASALGRGSPDFDPDAALFTAILQDPVLSKVKLVAEPWDVEYGGYQLGHFPAGWAEWNDRYRSDVRRFWRGDPGMVPALATRLAGSSDVFGASDRGPAASMNFVTAHDGFTLLDLVSYASKHNDANGEENRDGESNNHSFNSGAEGATDDPGIVDLRRRQRRNFLATLFLSLGVPMVSGGDELGRTQSGNNNAYTHDSPLSWTPWDGEDARAFVRFVASLAAVRRAHPALRRREFLDGPEVKWLRPDGGDMTGDDWNDAGRHALGMLLDGRAIREAGPQGQPQTGPTIAAFFNAGGSAVTFKLPPAQAGGTWLRVIDTASETPGPGEVAHGEHLVVAAQAVVALRSGD